MATKNSKLKLVQYYCPHCDYYTSIKHDYNKHLITTKHIRVTNGDKNVIKIHACNCGKEFKYRQGLSRHKKICNIDNNTDDKSEIPYVDNNNNDMMALFHKQTNLIFGLVKENKEFKALLIEQNKQMMEMAKKAGNNTNCNNTNSNNKFNLNFFLNETCKNAITMNDFIQTMEVTVDDFINTGNVGFVDGISKVIVDRMREMEMHTRPMHCTDLKRETIYIKDSEKWEKDEDKKVLRNAIKHVAKKNHAQLYTWFDNSQPEVEQIGTEECENYFKYYKAALGGYGKEENMKFEDKIMRNIMKETTIDKQLSLG